MRRMNLEDAKTSLTSASRSRGKSGDDFTNAITR